jgi:hypothetical protein
VRLVALAWARGGYRGGHGVEGARVRLPVERGELLLTVRLDGRGRCRVELTAALGVEGAPEVDGAVVRFAAWVKRLFGGPSPEMERQAADAAWASAKLPPAARIERAGGALSVQVRCEELPDPGDVVRWARAVHAHLLGDDERDG